jgi:hypothetical protein
MTPREVNERWQREMADLFVQPAGLLPDRAMQPRGECQTQLGLVWRETGAVRNARPSRGQSGVHQEEAQWGKEAEPPRSWGYVRCV